MTLEAAVIFPAVLSFIFLFILLMRIVVVEVVIQQAAMESVHQISGVLYPFEATLRDTGAVLAQLDPDQLEWIPESIKQWLQSINNWPDMPEEQLQRLLSAGLKPIIWSYIPDQLQGVIIHYDQLTVTKVELPYVQEDQAVFSVELQYELKLNLPYYHKVITITKQAGERVWFGL
jgi:hypothetical protein